MKYTKKQLKEINNKHDNALALKKSSKKRDKEISKQAGFSRIGHNNI